MNDLALDVLDFWWTAGPERWFARSDAFDADCRHRFLASHEAAAAGSYDDWRGAPHSALALILLLDQMPRNLFREDARAFATDAKALQVAQEAVAHGFDKAYANIERRFFHMPFMHSEDLDMQQRCVDLCLAAKDQEGVYYAMVHLDVIRRFGRFPHRNVALGRTSTPEEIAFLDGGGFSA
ncbi:MAG: DUF924 family protein [Pseudomonadota bacterium]